MGVEGKLWDFFPCKKQIIAIIIKEKKKEKGDICGEFLNLINFVPKREMITIKKMEGEKETKNKGE